MSLPRISHTHTQRCLRDLVDALRIKGRDSTGVFWSEALERMLEKAVETKAKYALTIDYDTLFTPYHVVDLYNIMENHPELAAVYPLQSRRGHPFPMTGTFQDEEGDVVTVTKGGRFKDGIAESDTGHFGLTLLRLNEIKKLKKPWFQSKPNKDNLWHQGKKEADVNFWINCKKQGLKVALGQVWIVHLEDMCSVPGPEEQNFKTRYCHVKQIIEQGYPLWAMPKSLKQGASNG